MNGRVYVLCSVLCLMAHAMLAQSTSGEITGRVTDPSGLVIVNAQVTALNTNTGVRRETASNELGNYTIPLLNPGSYEISVSKGGFRSITRSGITLNVDQAVRLDFAMEVGAVTETVEITGEAPLVDSERSALGAVVQNREIVSLPMASRTTTGMALMVAGVVPTGNAVGDSGMETINFGINGGRGMSSDVLVDGISLTVPEANPDLNMPFVPQVDVIQEFKVLTNSLPAEYGRSGGGIVNYVYKSGTNQLHGSVFEFLQNSALNSNNFFNNRQGVPLASFRLNQFGATVGGPVVIPHLINGKDKLFFFGSYAGARSATQSTSTLTVPSLAERSGDFSQTRRRVGSGCQPVNIFDPFSIRQSGTGFVRTQFPNNIIPPSAIDPVAARVVTFYPAPNISGDSCSAANNYFASGAATTVMDVPTLRGDYYPIPSDRLFVRLSGRNNRNRAFDAIGTLGRTTDPKPATENLGDNVAFSYSRTFSPSTILEVRAGFSRSRSISAGTAAGTNAAGDNFDMRSTLGWTGSAGNFIDQMNKPLAFPQIDASGYTSLGTGRQAWNDTAANSYQWAGTVTKLHGAHSIKVGTDYRTLQETGPNAFFASGLFTFGPNFTQGPNPTSAGTTVGNAVASLLTGLGIGPSQAQINPRLFVSNNYLAFFVQDDYRVTKKLVLNLGLRWDMENGRSERFNQLSYFDFTAPSPLASKVASLPNLHGGLKFVGVNGNPSRQFDTDWNNFGPRAGLAYSFNSKTALRVGYGIMYEPFIGRACSSGAGYTGFGQITTWVSSLDGVTPYRRLSNPFPDGLVVPPGSSLGLLTQVGDNLGSDAYTGRDGAFDRKNVVGYVQQWNVSVQRALPADISLELTYAGNKGTKLADGGGFQEDQLPSSAMALGNQLLQSVPNPFFGVITSGPLAAATTTLGQLLRPYPQFTNLLNYRPSAASSIYHAFRLQLEKRLSRGVQFAVAYTNGKVIDDSSSMVDNRGNSGGSGRHQDYYNRHADRSVSFNDFAHRLVLSYVVDLPFGRGRLIGANWSRLTDVIIGGWQFNGITTFQSGRPLIIENSSNNSGAYSDLQRPNVDGRSPLLPSDRPTQDKLAQWFDTSVFSQPAAFTFGNCPRTLPNVRSDGVNNFDLSLFKNFHVIERAQVQFRAEFFNAFNRPQFNVPGQLFGAAGFGVVSSQFNSPRQVQFGLKILF